MVYDPSAKEYVLFGGVDATGTALDSTWVYAGGSWSNLSSALSTAPSPRWYPSFVWDAADSICLLFGGMAYGSTFNDTWSFNGTAWQLLSPARSPPSSFAGRIVYDAADGYVLLAGEQMVGASIVDENYTWSYSAGVWTNLSSTVKNAPSALHSVTGAAYDPSDGYVVLYGGSVVGTTCAQTGNTWTYLNGTYSYLTRTGYTQPPVAFGSRMMAEDPALGGVVFYGGWSGQESNACPFSNQTWVFHGGIWYNDSTPAGPGPRWDSATAADGAGSFLLFAGIPVLLNGGQSDDTWTLTPALTAWAAGTPLSGSIPLTVNGTSVTTGVGPFTYDWNWGDGTADSSSANATHDYTTVGTYTIHFRVTGAGGRAFFTNLTVRTQASMVASAWTSALEGDAPLAIRFTSSVVGAVPPDSYRWDFGDGGGASTQDANHSYGAQGSYTWQLNVTDSRGRTASASSSIHVGAAMILPAVMLNRTRGSVPLTVGFEAPLTGGSPPYVFTWTFGDGQLAATGVNSTSHTFVAAGLYDGNVAILDAYGGSVSAGFSVDVGPAIVPQSHGPSRVAAGPDLVQFTGNATGGFPPYDFEWTFGVGGSTESGATVGYAFLTPGNVLVTLTTTDSAGDVQVNRSTVDVVAPLSVVLDLAHPVIIVSTRTVFTVTTLGGYGPYGYAWNFGDGSTASGSASESHAFSSPGVYPISVGVSDGLGEQQLGSAPLRVVAPLSVVIDGLSITTSVGSVVWLRASTLGGLAPVTVAWSGLPAPCSEGVSSLNLNCTPSQSGDYVVTVTVNDSLGEVRSASANLSVSPCSPGGCPSSSLGVPPLDLVAAGVAVVAIGVAVVRLLRRRSRRPPAPIDDEPSASVDPDQTDPTTV